MSIVFFMTAACILEAITAPIEAAINKPRPKVYRKPDHHERRR